MKKIVALIDYKGNFGSKHFDEPYRSGLNKDILREEFLRYGYEIVFVPFHSVGKVGSIDTQCYYLYTSSEDIGYFYKSFIEDIVLSLEISGVKIIPDFQFLRANNNKVFMELIRNRLQSTRFKTIRSSVYGTLEELKQDINLVSYPVVIKKAEGASGSGVFKADSQSDLISVTKKVSRSFNLYHAIWDFLRSLKHKGYIRESNFRRKYIVQNMIENLTNDWKVYFFGDKFYVFYRPIFKSRGFRASGGGYDNYFYGDKANVPAGLLDYISEFVQNFRVPHASIDVAYDGKDFHIIEFQFTYFGTAGIVYSDGYFKKDSQGWQFIPEKHSIEKVYVDSIIQFINK